MELLTQERFEVVRALVPRAAAAGHMAFVHAVLDGLMPGSVLVDDAERPTSVLAFNHCGFDFALGEPVGADELRAVVPLIQRECVTDEPTSLWATNPAWEPVLDAVFERTGSRNEYHAWTGALPPAPSLPPGMELRRIDATIAAGFGRGGPGKGVDPWVIRVWGGPEAFAANHFGWAVMDGDIVAAFCTYCGLGGHPGDIEAEIEIGTDPDYRQRGLATIAGGRFIEECRERGLRPAWTCATDNIASARLAERLGFREFRKVAGYPLAKEMVRDGGRWRVER